MSVSTPGGATRKGSARTRVTSAEVARRAGVSRATVSYVLNDDPSQSFTEATRARVHQAAAELGYVPNMSARALRVGRTNTVLMPLPGTYLSPVWAGIVDVTARALAARGTALVADFTSYGSPEAQVEAGLRLHPAAVVDTFVVDPEVIRLFESQGVYVLTSRPAFEADPSVDPGRRVRNLQVDHLLERGCRRIASVGQTHRPDESRQGAVVDEELARRCRAAKAGFEAHLVDPADLAAIRALAGDLASRGPRRRVDGLAVVNDQLAVSLVMACVAAGLRVPDDIAVIGLDDHPIGAATTPSLTTVAWDLEAFATDLARSVEAALAGGRPSLGLERARLTVLRRESA